MASVTVKSNADEVFKTIGVDLLGLLEITAFRPMMFDLVDMMKERIHKNGQATDESQIGTYSPGYMAVRTGIFASNERISRGKDKGKPKPEGVFTKGVNKGKPRPKYNRDSSTKIIVSLTRKLENSWIVIATDDGYDIGFSDGETSYDKAKNVESIKDKIIFDPSPTEIAFIDDFINKELDKILNG